VPRETVPPDVAALLGDTEDEPSRIPVHLRPQRLLRGLWSRRTLIALVTLLVMGLVAVAAYTLVERKWEAVTTLILRQDVEELSVGGGKPYRVPEYRIETLLDTLKLPSSLTAAADAAGVDASPLTLAVALDVAIARNSDVLNLKLTWTDPHASARLANAVAEAFVERTRRIRVDEAAEDLARYRSQLEDARRRVELADAAVLAFQHQHEVSDFDEETKARLIDLSRLEAEHRTVLAEVDGLRTARGELEAAIAAQPEIVTSSTLYRNPLRKRLEEYQWQLKEARSRYTASNPKVVKLEREVAALRLVLSEAGDESAPERTDGPNELRNDMRLRQHELNDAIRKEEGRANGLAASVQEIREKLAYLSAREKEYAALKANQDAARQLESSLAAKAEEARVAAASGEAAFAVLEPAMTPTDPAPSGRKLMLAAGGVLGLGAGMALALGLAVFDRRIRHEDDLSSLLDEGAVGAFTSMARLAIGREHHSQWQSWLRLVNDFEATGLEGSVAVVSLTDDEPRGTVAWNVAAVLATRGRETVLVSFDRSAPADDAVHQFGRPVSTEIPGLKAAVASHLSPADGTGFGAIPARIRRLESQGARAVIDVPPLADDELAVDVAVSTGRVILVAKSGVTDADAAGRLVRRLEARGVHIVGAVLSDAAGGRPKSRRSRAALFTGVSSGHGTPDHASAEVQHA
jgi:uncharacterized protein involved in exopolysaccharide biosynthesis